MTTGIIIEDLSVLSDTTELQLRAYNEAFVECGVPWEWDLSSFDSLRHIPDSSAKVDYYNEINGGLEIHSPQFIYTAKNSFFERLFSRNSLYIKPGVEPLLQLAHKHDVPVLIAAMEPHSIVHQVLASAKIPLHWFKSILSKSEVCLHDSFFNKELLEVQFAKPLLELFVVQNPHHHRTNPALYSSPQIKSILFNGHGLTDDFTILNDMNDIIKNIINLPTMR
ncbi:MAG: hypothetical protein P8J70_12360 [Glaciecola sp.]|jgi:hypothetical protein|nr:hypothetical protein [Glaciecola sp.]MDG1814863.1 hypothetical protein [Glaciecola sp.]MDG2100452.1 hypothetical protein [Glaciecola sp.]